MIYSHWSDKPLVISPEYVYPKDRTFKPAGLWFDVGGDWKRWCEAENFRQDYLAVRNVLSLNLDGILRLSSAQDLDRFTEQYAGLHSRYSRLGMAWPGFAATMPE